MLDTAKILLGKLRRQYGFRPGRSTINADQELVYTTRSTERGNYFFCPLCLLATLDVINAFNSVGRNKVLDDMRYILTDHLINRFIIYKTDDGS